MNYARWICLTTSLTILFTGSGLWLEQRLKGEPAAIARPAAVEAMPETIQVLVTGAVARPGLYRLPSGSQQQNLIDLAGGLVPEAQSDQLQLTRPLQAGEVLNIPARAELASVAGDTPPKDRVSESRAENVSQASPKRTRRAKGPSKKPRQGQPKHHSKRSGPVSLNQGSVSDFDSLPGVGPALAERIVEWRQAHGGFKAIEDLLEVKGIGPKKLDKMKGQLRL